MAESINAYLQEIGRHPVLSKTAQLTHAKNVHAWVNHPDGRDGAPLAIRSRGQRSMNALIRTNLRLVVTVAKKYQYRGLDLPDLIQEGSIGLIRGLELYDPTRGYVLCTYVYWLIRQAVTRACVNTGRAIRLPIHTHELLYKISTEREKFQTEHGRRPTIEELAERTKSKPEKIRDAIEVDASTFCYSYDATLDGDDESRLYYLADSDSDPLLEMVSRDIEVEQLHPAIESLDEIDRKILNQRIFDRSSFSEIAEKNKLTVSQVRHLYAMAVNHLKVWYCVRRLTPNRRPEVAASRMKVAC